MRLNEMVDPILSAMSLELRWKVRMARQFAPFLLGASLPVRRLKGLVLFSGRPATILVAGHEPWVDYLPRRFFAEQPKSELVCRSSLWELPHALSSMRASADLTIVRVDRISARLWFSRDYLKAPEWVDSTVKLDDESLALAFKRNNVRNELRKIRRHRLSWSVSHDARDFDLFYQTMYAPYARERFGEMVGLATVSYLRQEFKRGGLLFVVQNGERIAASLFRLYGKDYYFLKLGTRNGAMLPVKIGALAALYPFGIEHARGLGCKLIDFGGSRSLLQDGPLRFKLKWNASIGEHDSHSFQYLIHWNLLSGAAADFFLHNSLIFYDRGRLSAIHAPEDDDPATVLNLSKLLRINGLHHLYLVSRKDPLSDSIPPPGVSFLSAATKPGQFQSFKGFKAA